MLSRKYSKYECYEAIDNIHDALKGHEYLQSNHAPTSIYGMDYRKLCYNLSEAWNDMIYGCKELTPEESAQLQGFGMWIHNYRSFSYSGVPRGLIPFYERILQATHRWLRYGTLEYTYDIFRTKWKTKNEFDKGFFTVKYEWLTKEKVGFDTHQLPRYMPIETKPLCEDVEEYRKLLYSPSYWHVETPEEKESWVANWENNILPIVKWINQNRIGTGEFFNQFGAM